MLKRDSVRTAVRLALLAGTAAALGATPVVAQVEEPIAEVVVTGSRIVRPGLETPIPIMAVGQDEFDNRGMRNFADLATSLPQFTPAFGSSRTQSTFSGVAASGLNQANLRNLGAVRSVVLINGRRVPGGTSTNTAVDFNTIPTANIERIETLTGGASAIYGADAVAGVINLITRRDFEGIEIGASYGESGEGDNQNPSAHLMVGGAFGDRGHGLLTLQYDRQGRVSCADRYVCAEDFLWLNPDTQIRGPNAYSGVGLAGTFFTPDGLAITRRNGSFVDEQGQLIQFSTPIDGYNRNAVRDLAIPTTRIMVAAQGDYEVTDGMRAFAELNYGQAEIESQFEGHPFQSNQPGSLFGGGPGIAGLQPSIPIDNPFVPAPLRAQILAEDPDATEITWWQRFAFNNRGATSTRESVRAVVGFNGEFDSLAGFGSDWHWEVHYVYGRTDVNLGTDGLVGTDRLYYGLRVEPDPDNPGAFRCSDPAARATGCIPINPFADYTQEMLDYLIVSASSTGRSELENIVGYLGGSLFELPAGPLSAVLGVEYRRFSGFLDYDNVINKGLATGNQIQDVDFAAIHTREAFVETVVPIVRDLPFARAVNLEAAYRRSESDGSTEYGTWKYGGDWAPIDELRIRAMRARSVRTPVPGELSGIGQTFGVVQDPCTVARRNANPTRAANCAADGVPADYNPGQIIEQGVAGLTGGNPDLEPEVATTLTYGFVWTPSFAPGLAITVDRFQLEIDEIIASVSRQTALNMCYDTVDRQFCDVVTRGSHVLLPGADYVLESVNEQLQNVASMDIRGVDVSADYAFDLGGQRDLGRLSLSALITFYDKAEQVPLPGDDPLDLLGAAGGSTIDQGYVRRTANANIGWMRGGLTANWNMRYIGKADMSPDSAEAGFPKIGSHVYHNLRAGYTFDRGMFENTEVYVGINNVFDKEPPFFASGTAGTQALDTIPGYYDIFGRSYFAGTRIRF